MGREHGFLALAVGIASGAEYVIIPEVKYDLTKLCNHLEQDKRKGKTSEIIIFAEGAGNAPKFAKQIQNRTGIEVRVSSLGYIQRGGAPSARSRILGSQFGAYAIDLINKKKFNRILVVSSGKVCDILLSKTFGKEKKFDYKMYNLVQRLAC